MRADTKEKEREKWLEWMNPQEYKTFHKDGRKWVDTVTEFAVRTDAIQCKIKDLMPDLHEIAETDYNFINRMKGKAELRKLQRHDTKDEREENQEV